MVQPFGYQVADGVLKGKGGAPGLSRRALLRAGIAAGGAAALAACGAQGAPSQPAPAAKLAGQLQFWQWGVSYVDGFNRLAAEFNEKHPGAEVVHTQPSDYDNKIKVTLAAGSGGPDVYLLTGPNYKKYAHDGLAAAISSYLSRDKAAAADLKELLKAAVDYYNNDGKPQGLPWDLSTISVAYNLDAMERRGLKPPAELGEKWDWNAYLEYAKQLTAADGSVYGVDANPGIETGWYNWGVANGARFWSPDYKTPMVNSPPMIEAVEQFMSVANKLRASPPRDWIDERNKGQPHRAYVLINGLTAMQNEGDWFFGWYDRAQGLRWDVAPVPVSPHTKKTGSVANMRGIILSPQAQNRDLAWAWMTYLIKREVQDRIPSLMGEVPARLDSIDQVYLNPTKMPSPKSRKLLKASIDATVPLPGHPLLPWGGDGSVNGTANLNPVYDGKQEARAALNDIQQQLMTLISQAGG